MDEHRPAETRFLTLSHACRRYRVSSHTLRAAIADGKIPAFRIGQQRWLRLDPADLDAWVRSQQVEASVMLEISAGTQEVAR